jgi:hypothetical protein
MVKLSQHFYLYEFFRSSSYPNIAENMMVTLQHVHNMQRLCEEILEEVRALHNVPLTLNSGFRSRKLNKKIKGSRTSDHMYGAAADVVNAHIINDPIEVAEKLWNKSIPFRQLIAYKDKRFLHVSINHDSKPSVKEFLIAEGFGQNLKYRRY